MNAPSRSAALRVKLALTAPTLNAAAAALWEPSGGPSRHVSRYVAYLYAMHALIRASVPLMERAALRCGELPPGDPSAVPLARYLEQHIEEERGHDDWLLDDLAAAGADPAPARHGIGPPVVAGLAGAQYYWVEHHHPVALLGYIRVLEGNAPAPWLAGRLAARTGLPAAAFRTVREHAELDTGHLAAVDGLIDSLPLTRDQEEAVTVSALHTADGVARLFLQLAATPGGSP
ncbi:iron-containing redox enzyme family protein [Streptomyces sp. NPDC003247]|uniref:iron-containing redox enzyme family protein n=1 Tax=Streptomyces sp. NPDC003247 TaxID=3364677 RepID=UPI00367C2921